MFVILVYFKYTDVILAFFNLNEDSNAKYHHIHNNNTKIFPWKPICEN